MVHTAAHTSARDREDVAGSEPGDAPREEAMTDADVTLPNELPEIDVPREEAPESLRERTLSAFRRLGTTRTPTATTADVRAFYRSGSR